jgi:hypothetical protein
LQAQIEALGPWFHNLHLPGGVQTAPHHFIGGDFPRFKWLEIAPHIPQDLRGWRVLDVGCNAGFYSFELARRGASVLAIDVEDLYLTQARWAAACWACRTRWSSAAWACTTWRDCRSRSTWCGSWASSITCATRCWRWTCWRSARGG